MTYEEILKPLLQQPCSSGAVFEDCKVVRAMEAEGLVTVDENCEDGSGDTVWVSVTKTGYNMVVKNNPGITGYYGEVLEEWK